MRTRTRYCNVAMSRAALWDCLSDYANVVHLASPGSSASLVHGRAGLPGAKYAASVDWEGLESSFHAVLTEAVRPSISAFSARSAGCTASVRFVLEAIDDTSTRVSATAALKMGAALFPLEPFAWALLDRLFERLMRKLHALESAPASDPATANM